MYDTTIIHCHPSHEVWAILFSNTTQQIIYWITFMTNISIHDQYINSYVSVSFISEAQYPFSPYILLLGSVMSHSTKYWNVEAENKMADILQATF